MPTLWHRLQLIFLIRSAHRNRNSGIRINLDEDSAGSLWNTDALWLRLLCARLASFCSCKTADYSSWWQFCCSLSILTVLFFPLFPAVFFFYFMFQVSECNWPSRQAPSLHNLFAVCKNMHNWLKQNPKNVCVITCSVRKKKHSCDILSLHSALFCHSIQLFNYFLLSASFLATWYRFLLTCVINNSRISVLTI